MKSYFPSVALTIIFIDVYINIKYSPFASLPVCPKEASLASMASSLADRSALPKQKPLDEEMESEYADPSYEQSAQQTAAHRARRASLVSIVDGSGEMMMRREDAGPKWWLILAGYVPQEGVMLPSD